MSKQKLLALAVCSMGTLALGQSVNAAAITGTTYAYQTGTDATTCCGNDIGTAVSTTLEDPRESGSFGNGILNNGNVGNQAYLDSQPIRSDGYNGQFPAYQLEGGIGDQSAAGFVNTATESYTSGAYLNTGGTVLFDLGASYNNLSTVTIHYASSAGGFSGTPAPVTISDGTTTLTALAFQDSPDDAPAGNGTYYSQSFDISSLSGQNISLSFGGAIAFNEIQFEAAGTAVPEPASLGLLSLAGLAVLRRRRA